MNKFSFDNLSDILTEISQEIRNQRISILIPYYNEQDIICKNTQYVLNLVESWKLNAEIIVSDDGSQDQGFSLLTQQFKNNPSVKLIHSPRNYGKGRALLTAYEESTGEYILFLDCDLELPFEHFPYFLHHMITTNSDIVIGSKQHPASNINYPLIRKVFSNTYALINKILFRLNITDTQTGIKLFRRSVLEKIFPYLLVKKFAFDIELLALAQHKNYKIETHPIILEYTRPEALGRMSLDTILHMLKDTIAIFWRLKIGFWKVLPTNKLSLKYAKIYITDNPTNNQENSFYVNEISQVANLLPQLKQYDAVIFIDKHQEIPVFAHHILNRIFSNAKIKAVLPVVYPLTVSKNEELYYTMLGNICFSKGYYPYYRLVKQESMQSLKNSIQMPIIYCVLRISFLQEIFNKQQQIPIYLSDFESIYHSPFYFIHSKLPQSLKEFYLFTNNSFHQSVGIKKIMHYIILFLWLLGTVGIFAKIYFLIMPVVILEICMYLWYIYSLGIRKSVLYLILFYRVRIYFFFKNMKNLLSTSISLKNKKT